MTKSFLVGEKAVYTPVLNGFGKPQVVTIVGVTGLKDRKGNNVQGICRRADGIDQIIHVEHLTHVAK